MTASDAHVIQLLQLTTKLVIKSIETGGVWPQTIPLLIANVFKALDGVALKTEPMRTGPLRPAVPVSRSIHPDYLVCLEDGKRYQSMRGHLRALGMTPDEYRQKWKLPADYPMVADSYRERRSKMAKSAGLGRRGG
jgi:predicted transcriptional regulator